MAYRLQCAAGVDRTKWDIGYRQDWFPQAAVWGIADQAHHLVAVSPIRFSRTTFNWILTGEVLLAKVSLTIATPDPPQLENGAPPGPVLSLFPGVSRPVR